MIGPSAPHEVAAMRRALALAAAVTPDPAPNPRVGAVVLDAVGTLVGEGAHERAGGPHAEVIALAAAGDRARGGTIVVTLEPCAHTGRTGPCTEAVISAGITRVVIAQTDPNPVAAGGIDRLRAAGLDVTVGVLADEAADLTRAWVVALQSPHPPRPHVVWKVAATLDGRVAAVDGTSRWITGPQARDEVHALRAEVDAIIIGTGTALVDDPHLTARRPDGTLHERQPLRVIVGTRDLPPPARVLDDTAPTLHLRTHDPREVLTELRARGVRRVLLEGGPTLAAAFLRAHLIDQIRWYAAPLLLGDGFAALSDVGATTLAAGVRLVVDDVRVVGADVCIEAHPMIAVPPISPDVPPRGQE
jgi:diaminohydroxyphosphoribosylaminopyrimidine deaminase/5-amino-6-(5-phosphoribosylamino)uracil reductase